MTLINACTLFAMYANSDFILQLTPEPIRQLEADSALAMTLSGQTIICIERI